MNDDPAAPAPEVTAEPLIETIRRAVNCSEITKSLAEEIVSYLQSKEVTAEPVAWRWRYWNTDQWEYCNEGSPDPSLFEVQPLYAHPPTSDWNEQAMQELGRLAEDAILASFQAGQSDGMRGYGALPDADADRRQVETESALHAAIRALKREPR